MTDKDTTMIAAPEASRSGGSLLIPWRRIPWWGVIIALLAIAAAYGVLTSETYLKVLSFVLAGVRLTLQTTVLSFALALALGLLGGLGRVSKNPLVYAIATLYVEVIRGLPMLVIILYMGFVVGPIIRD